MHSTASEAAAVARKAGVKMLVLTHISTRYKTGRVLQAEARKVFKNTEVAKDGLTITL
jgi:ribonuclease Z